MTATKHGRAAAEARISESRAPSPNLLADIPSTPSDKAEMRVGDAVRLNKLTRRRSISAARTDPVMADAERKLEQVSDFRAAISERRDQQQQVASAGGPESRTGRLFGVRDSDAGPA